MSNSSNGISCLYIPACTVCGQPADYSLGNGRVYWCDLCFPDWARAALSEQEAEREAYRAKLAAINAMSDEELGVGQERESLRPGFDVGTKDSPR